MAYYKNEMEDMQGAAKADKPPRAQRVAGRRRLR